VVDVDHAEVAVPDELAQVGAEVDGDAIGERAAPGHLDAAALADRAVGAVGGDQVVGADGLGGAAVPGAEDRRDPVVVLLEGDQVGGVGVLGAALLGRPAQQRLQPDLGDEQPRRRAQRLDALVEAPEEELQLRATQALHRDDGAVLHELPRRRGLDLPLQPHTAEDFHGPLVKRGGPGVNRGAAVPLDQQVWHPLCGQQQRCRQPHEAASHDQHGHLAVAHRAVPRASGGHGHSSRVAATDADKTTLVGWARMCQGPQEHPHSPARRGGYGPRPSCPPEANQRPTTATATRPWSQAEIAKAGMTRRPWTTAVPVELPL